MNCKDIQQRLDALDSSIQQRIGNYTLVPGKSVTQDNPYQNIFVNDEDQHPDHTAEPFDDTEILDADENKSKKALATDI